MNYERLYGFLSNASVLGALIMVMTIFLTAASPLRVRYKALLIGFIVAAELTLLVLSFWSASNIPIAKPVL